MARVFLGGTCNESIWRNQMMSHLYYFGLEYFNPVVDDWNNEAQANELRERRECDINALPHTSHHIGYRRHKHL